ncbi:hypothetical protein FQV37_1158 [Psychrobacter nivimaris]|uniref:Uncharacterized protein n=1 Tax=Psychrobacter nivimaris TaxID=281738 RepID=A0A6N7BZ38_9GAMM|nr:hypothetical protein FQV37_1158 [Psychrobacter nivimaris]
MLRCLLILGSNYWFSTDSPYSSQSEKYLSNTLHKKTHAIK